MQTAAVEWLNFLVSTFASIIWASCHFILLYNPLSRYFHLFSHLIFENSVLQLFVVFQLQF